MAEVIATAISTALLTEASVVTFSTILTATQVALAVAAVSAGNYQRRKAQAKAIGAYNASLEDRLVMASTTQAARSRCYGRVRNVDGVIFKATRGVNKEFYTLFIAVAGHEIDGFEQVYFGDKAVTLDGNGYVQTEPYNITSKATKSVIITLDGTGAGSTTSSGTIVAGSAAGVQPSTMDVDERTLTASVSGSTINVSGGTAGASATITWQESSASSKARVRFYTGAPGQDLSTVLQPLFPDLIDAGQHRFDGIAGMLVDLEFDTDAYPTGLPAITAVFRGAKVFDPRTSATAWTQNPALIARDWALHGNGGGCAVGDLSASAFNAAANACDTVQSFTTTTGTENLPLYTCGIVCNTSDDPWQTFQEIVESMAGKSGWAGGLLRVVAGVYRAPVATITEDWISDKEPIQIVPEPPTDEAVNIYRPTISDAGQGYLAVPAPEVRAASYISADGRELPREVTLGGVTDTTHAQHVCGVLMRDSRNGLAVVLPCNLRAFQVELFDIVSVTLPRYGWSAKTFEVVDWKFSLSGGVLLTLKETAAAIYQPDALFQVVDLTPNTQLPNPFSVPLVENLSVTTSVASFVDGQPIVRALVQWDLHTDAGVLRNGRIEIQYIRIGLIDAPVQWINNASNIVTWTNAGSEVSWNSLQQADTESGNWQSIIVTGGQTDAVITGLNANAIYIFRSRAENVLGVHSDWSFQRVLLTGDGGKVGTRQIEEGAATGVYTNTISSYNVTQSTGIQGNAPGPYRRRLEQVVSVPFVASITGSCFVEVYGSLLVTTGGTNGSFEYGIREAAAYSDNSRVVAIDQSAGIGPKRYSVNLSLRVAVTAGVSYTVIFGAARFDSSMTVVAEGIELAVQEIKR